MRWILPIAVLGSLVDGCTLNRALPLDVQFDGCEEVWRPLRCVVSQRSTLRLWTRDSTPPAVELDGEKIPFTTRTLDGGLYLNVEFTPDAGVLSVRQGARQWRLPISRQQDRPTLSVARDKHASSPESARTWLAEAIADADPDLRARGLTQLRMWAFRDGDWKGARTYGSEAAKLFDRSGCVSCAVESHLVLAYLATFIAPDFDRAERELRIARAGAHAYPAGAAQAIYYQALLDNERGRLGDGMRALRESAERFTRLGDTRHTTASLQVLARQLQSLGQHDEARQIFASLVEDRGNDSQCTTGQLFNNAAWASLLALEAGLAADPGRIESWLHEARGLFTAHCPSNAPDVDFNLALLDYHRREHRSAWDRLQAVQVDPERVELWSWREDLAGRIELARGNASASLERYRNLSEQCLRTVGACQRASYGRAQAHRALGDRARMFAAFEDAERQLNETARAIAFGDGRDGFFSTQHGLMAQYIEELVIDGDVAGAFAAARRERTRFLRSLARLERVSSLRSEDKLQWDRAATRFRQITAKLNALTRDRWKVPVEEQAHYDQEIANAREERARSVDDALAVVDDAGQVSATAAKPGDLWIFIHPVGSEWFVFAHTAMSTRVARHPDPTGWFDGETSPLLAAFDDTVADAERVAFMTTGTASDLDLERLPWRGRPLIGAKPVRRRLDLPSLPPAARSGHAVLVSDPELNLPLARQEVQEIRPTLNVQYGRVLELSGASAEPAALVASLADANHLHYAGHAFFKPEGVWESGFRLANGSRFSVRDILTLREVPETIVLIGCESGRALQTRAVQGLGIAHSWLVRGAREVVGTSRRVPDRLSLDFSKALYGNTAPGRRIDLETAFRSAYATLMHDRPDVGAFRLFSRE